MGPPGPAQEWTEQRHRSPESVAAAVSTDETGFSLPVGAADVQRRFTRIFFFPVVGAPRTA